MNLDTSEAVLIDFDHLARQSFSDRILERDLLELFAEQCGTLLSAIAGANPLRERLIAAHTLKGSARAVGAWELATLVECVEATLKRGDADCVSDLIGGLADVVQATQTAALRGRAEG